MKDNDVFASKISELRSSLDLTQEAFTQDLGITPAALSSYEQGTKKPSLKTVIKIANKYKVSVDWLCGLSERKIIGDSLATCGDIIREIDRLSQVFHLDDYRLNNLGEICLTLTNKDMVDFYTGNLRMLDLLHDGTIDNHLYDLWYEDAIKKMDKIIYVPTAPDSEDQIEELPFV